MQASSLHKYTKYLTKYFIFNFFSLWNMTIVFIWQWQEMTDKPLWNMNKTFSVLANLASDCLAFFFFVLDYMIPILLPNVSLKNVLLYWSTNMLFPSTQYFSLSVFFLWHISLHLQWLNELLFVICRHVKIKNSPVALLSFLSLS